MALKSSNQICKMAKLTCYIYLEDTKNTEVGEAKQSDKSLENPEILSIEDNMRRKEQEVEKSQDSIKQ